MEAGHATVRPSDRAAVRAGLGSQGEPRVDGHPQKLGRGKEGPAHTLI